MSVSIAGQIDELVRHLQEPEQRLVLELARRLAPKDEADGASLVAETDASGNGDVFQGDGVEDGPQRVDQNIHASSTGSFHLSPHAVYDLHPTAEIYLIDDFYLGDNLRKGSQAESYLKMHQDSVLEVRGRFKVCFHASIEVFSGAKLTLGRGYINSDTVIACAKEITIGERCAIARGVFIYDSDNHKLLGEDGEATNASAPVHIGDRVWIGVGAIILKGVTIGDGAVVAAGAVVTRDVPSRCIVAGNPARVVRENVDWK